MGKTYYDEIQLRVVVIKNKHDKKCVDEAIYELCDEDFNGNNGTDYTSENALNLGFESNYDCYINTHEMDVCEAYIEEMLDQMLSYSYDYKIEYTEIENTDTLVVSVAVI